MIAFPQQITMHPQLVKNFLKISFHPKYVNLLAISSIVASFCHQIDLCAKIGGLKILTVPITEIHPLVKHYFFQQSPYQYRMKPDQVKIMTYNSLSIA